MRERSAAKLLLWGAAGVAAAGAGVLLYFVDPAESAWLPGCPLRTLTGLNCAGCGGTRGLHALLHGAVAGWFRMNALLLPLLALAGLLAWKPRLAAKPSVALCVAAVIILYSVARNLPCFPFLAPH